MFLKTFRWSFLFSALALVVAYAYGGAKALFLCLILGILEVSLSFDNAVVNASILKRMSEFWQRIFLTIGILIAVFGMRLVFPLLIVGVTASLNPIEALQLALEKGDPEQVGTYGYLLNQAHPQIAAFGGMFLLLLSLDFFFAGHPHQWLTWLERPLKKFGQLNGASAVVVLTVLLLTAVFIADDAQAVLISGILGIITYLIVNGLGNMFENNLPADLAYHPATGIVKATGKAGFFLFLYLEVLDASFSFDGVIGAFAITPDPVIIALGLGLIGALFVRSLTIFMVRKGTLEEFVYLEHGARWAIFVLAIMLLVSIGHEIPEVVTGLSGAVIIVASVFSSIREKRKALKSL